MKKLLLTLAVAALGFSAYAETATFTFTPISGESGKDNYVYPDDAYGLRPIFNGNTSDSSDKTYFSTENVATQNGITVTFNGDGNSWRLWTDGIRGLKEKNNTIVISSNNGSTITGVSYTGTMTFSNLSTNSAWSGSESSVTFTTNNTATKNIQTITVTYTPGGAKVASPTINFAGATNTVSIKGAEGATIYYTTNGNEPSNTSTKYENPFTVTTATTVKAIAYIGSDASAVATKEITPTASYNSFADYVKGTSEKAYGIVNGPLTAVYQSGQYLYLKDNSNGYMLIYGTIEETLSNGDQVASVYGQYSPYQNLPEIASPVLGTVTKGGTAVSPVATTIDDLESENMPYNSYISLSGITITATAEGNTTEYGISDSEGNTSILYNRFKLDVTAGSNYDIVGFKSVFGTNVQVYPTSITPGSSSSDTDPDPGTKPEPEAPVTQSVTFDFTDPTTLSGILNDAPIKFSGEEDSYSLVGVTLVEGPIYLSSEILEETDNVPVLWYSATAANPAWTFRFYKDSEITVSAAQGILIESIQFSANSNLGNSSITWTPGNYSSYKWTAPEGGVSELVITKTESGNTPQISTMTVNYTGTVGISDMATDLNNAPVEYYNLQGVRVNNPVKGGLYIVRQGKSAKKVIIR